MIKIRVLAGAIGQPVEAVRDDLRRRYPAKRVVVVERAAVPGRPRDPRKLAIHYDETTGLVYELKEG